MDHLLETAIRLAAKVHKGQLDRFNKPYILHVMRVMMRGHDFDEQVLGALHDVLERSDLSAEDLAKKGFSPRILKALDHITRRVDETYEQYIDRVMEDNLAIRVKLHDLADKMDLLHVEILSHADLKRYNKQLVAFHRMKKLVAQAKANMSLKTDVKPQGN
jgi:(p)ppGpp synthase/HD superfamily hydrolase